MNLKLVFKYFLTIHKFIVLTLAHNSIIPGLHETILIERNPIFLVRAQSKGIAE
jgi:hypothetical protein